MTANPKKLGLYRTTTFFRAFLMFAVDLFGYALFLPWVIYRHLHGKTFDPERVSKIAVFRLDGIGDLVLSAPAINALRKFFPKARITLFANKWSNGLAEMISGPDEVIYLDATFFKAFKKKVAVHSLLKERRQLQRIGRNRRYDLALDLRGDFFSILDACWLKPRWLFSRSSRAGSFLLTNMLAQTQEGYVSEALLNIRFIGKVTKQRTPPSNPELKPPPELDLNWIDQKLGDDYVCLAVAAPYVTRCYPTESWLEVIVKIRQKYKKPIAVLGSPDEYQYCQVITAQADEDVHNMAGKLSLTESVALIRRCRLFIGNDGGLIHIASAFQRPLVQLFGPASAVCFGHTGKNEHVIQKDCPFNPCAEPNCRKPENWCMERITPEEIYSMARRYL